MKTFLVFNEEKDPFDRLKLKRALSATDAYLVLWHLDLWFRNQLKYEKITDGQEKMLEKVRGELNRLLDEYEVDLNDLD